MDDKIKFYINHDGVGYGIIVNYEVACRKKVTKKILFFEYETMAPAHVKTSMRIPLFLYGDGERFFEFFTHRLFGEIDSEGLVRNKVVKTYGEDGSTIKEYDASDFLNEINKTKKSVADVGIDEQELISEINQYFAKQERLLLEMEERIRRENILKKQQRDIQNQAAQKILEDMCR